MYGVITIDIGYNKTIIILVIRLMAAKDAKIPAKLEANRRANVTFVRRLA